MKRVVPIAGLALITLMASVQPAYADLWDWLQEWSGPGPFHARGPNLMFDICPRDATVYPSTEDRRRQNGGKVVHFLRDFEVPDADLKERFSGDASPHVTCLFVDQRYFENRPGDNFGVDGVKLNVIEFGASARLHRAITLGFGGGAIKIASPHHTTWKGVITGPRLVIKPFLLYGSNEFWASSRTTRNLYLILGSVKYYVKENVILGHVRGADFGLKEGDTNFTFDVQNDRVASTGFIIDATDLIALLLRCWCK